jgi:hypothetical protein
MKDAALLHRPLVERLHKLNLGLKQQRAERSPHESGIGIANVGVHTYDQVPRRDGEAAPQCVSLTESGPEMREYLGIVERLRACRFGKLSGAVGRAAIKHDDFVNQLSAQGCRGVDDTIDRLCLVLCRNHHADVQSLGCLARRQIIEVEFVRVVRASRQPRVHILPHY